MRRPETGRLSARVGKRHRPPLPDNIANPPSALPRACVVACARMRAPKSGISESKTRARGKDTGAFHLGVDVSPMHFSGACCILGNVRVYTHPRPEGPVTFRRIYNLNPDPITPRKDGGGRSCALSHVHVHGYVRSWKDSRAEFYSPR